MKLLWAAVLWLAGFSAFAGGPPIEYRLDDVVFEFVTDEEMLPSWGYALRIEGTGKGSYHEGTADAPLRVREFEVDPAEVFALLEQCYRARFFELQDAYTSLPLPCLQPNGAVQVVEVVTADASMPAVTLRIGAYSKTIRYVDPHGSPPHSLVQIEKKLKELAGAGDP
jgi:hypothetical protein